MGYRFEESYLSPDPRSKKPRTENLLKRVNSPEPSEPPDQMKTRAGEGAERGVEMLEADEGSEELVNSGIEPELEPKSLPTVSDGNPIGIPECDFGLAQHEPLVDTGEQIDIGSDPLASTAKVGPTSDWEGEMRKISLRKPEIPQASQQVGRDGAESVRANQNRRERTE